MGSRLWAIGKENSSCPIAVTIMSSTRKLLDVITIREILAKNVLTKTGMKATITASTLMLGARTVVDTVMPAS